MTPSRWSLLILAGALLCGSVNAAAEQKPLRVGILVYNGVYNTEFIAPLDVFAHASVHTGGRLQVFTVAPTLGSVTTAEGLRILPQFSFATAPAIDWLIVPSGEHYRADSENPELVGWIGRIGRKSQVVHSNCWGAFLLAAAGLLDGRRATTYPQSLDEFAAAFPAIQVVRDQLLVDDDNFVTSAGGVVSYDAALYLLEKHFGMELAQKVATGLVINWDARRQAYTAAGSGS